MKPLHIFRLCTLIVASLTVLSFLYPKNGITIGGHRFDFTNLHELLYLEQVIYADISNIISDTATVKIKEEDLSPRNDSLSIQHTNGSLKLFRKFYNKLEHSKENEQLIRILHYGDSQIEADRISGTLREKLQAQFGGSGVGIVPIKEVSNARSNAFIDAENWLSNEITSKQYKARLNECGLWGCVFTKNDSGKQAWIQIKANRQAPLLQRDLRNVKLLCTGGINCFIKANASEETISSENTNGFCVQCLKPLDTAFSDIRISFTSGKNARLYGIALDGADGVTVDNVSLRGSSGIEFTKMDTALLKKQLLEMNTRMIIMQFGVNVVPNVIKDYSYYQKQFGSQLALFRKMAPDVAILVVGVSDMSRKEKGNYVSYPNITKIRNAMKQAAFNNDCAYWDLYEVMGGANSMPSWVTAKPALANKDYTHFNNRGAEIVGTKLYNALIEDYNYLLHKKTEKTIAVK
jgi:lysophospholipase L1-like esterase